MRHEIVTFGDEASRIVELAPDQDIFASGESPNDLISLTWGDNICGLIVHASSLAPAFFDLKTGIAGEVLQKLTQYNVKTAFVMGDIEGYDIRIRELAHDHRRHLSVQFFDGRDKATSWLLAET